MPKVIVLGRHGQLATALHLNNENRNPMTWVGSDQINFLDTSSLEDKISSLCADWIINCMAYTAVDRAESEPERATSINAKAVEKLAQHCEKKNISLIHISTDFVFDGEKNTAYTEEDPTHPLNVYGRSKLEGEKYIFSTGTNSYILRTSWLYSAHGNNFVKTILRLCKEKDRLSVVCDQIGSPTSCNDLAASLLKIIEKDQKPQGPSLFHYANQGVASWYDFAKEIVRLAGNSTFIGPILADAYPTPARRPHFSVMDKSKFCATFETSIPYWRDSLEQIFKKGLL